MQKLEEYFAGIQAIAIHQVKEWVEIISNIETVNRYEILDDEQARIGFAAEISGGFSVTLLRIWLKTHRPLNIQVLDANGEELLKIKRPFYFFFSDMTITDSNDQLVGHVKKRFDIVCKKYDLVNATGEVFAKIKAPIWRLWTFPVFNSYDQQVGVISKKWGGVIKEAFTDADKFRVEFPDGIRAPEKAIIMASALSVDLDYFENNAGRSSK